MDKEIGLSERELALICGVLHGRQEVSAAILYGSRAKGTHRPESDIDLALEGDIDALRAESIAADLDELPLPYRFGVKAFSEIRSAQLLEDIHRVGVVIYEKEADRIHDS